MNVNEKLLKEQWPAILNAMNDGLLIVSPEGEILVVNEALGRIIGCEPGDLVGESCAVLECDACEMVRQDGQEAWCALFRDNAPGVRKRRCRIMRRDGSYVPVVKNAAVLHGEGGEILGSVETLTDLSELESRERQIEELGHKIEESEGFHGMISQSGEMAEVFRLLEKAAQCEMPIILYGESGTGKQLAAQAIHEMGSRRSGPLVQLNCSSLNESLLESELFGHVKGSFTGAYRHRPGRFEMADGGDFFLDEVGDLPLSFQVKLLQVLETKSFERVGDNRPVSVDVRMIYATHQPLGELVARRQFRQDLFYRINVFPISLPPLRRRREDIPLLIEHFLTRMRRTHGKDIAGLSADALKLLVEHPWPGNVRQLKGVIQYAFVVAERGPIRPEHLPEAAVAQSVPLAAPRPGEEREKASLIEALRQSGGNKSEAARILGISRVTVWNRMRRYGIDLIRSVTP
jgi:PAS domain S-box-containing protein